MKMKTDTATALGNAYSPTSAPAVFYGCDGRYAGAVSVFIFIYDAIDINHISGLFPKHVISVPTGGNGNWSFSSGSTLGERFLTGITIAVSTTDFPAFTAAADSK